MTMDVNIQQRVRVEPSTTLINSSNSTTSSGSTRRSASPENNRSPAPPNTPSYSPNLPTATTTIPPRNIKRSFDVAFLMAPDENLAKKQLEQEKQLRLVTTGCLRNRTSPVLTQNTSPHSPISPHNMVITSNTALFGGITESSTPRAYSDHPLLGDMTDSPLRSSSQIVGGGAEVIARQHNQRLMSSTQHSKVGLFEHSGLLVPKTIYNHKDFIDRVSKSQSGGNKNQDLNLINISTSSSGFHHEDILEKSGREQTSSNKSQDVSSPSNTSTGVMIRSAFTKVTASTKFDPSNVLNIPLPTSPSSVSSISEGLSPDHITYQESMSPPALGAGPTTSPIPPHFMHSTSKPFQSPMPLLSPDQHLSPNPLPGSSPSGGKTLTSYTSAAFLLQQDSNNTKHIKASNGLCSSGASIGTSNGNFRNDIDSYLMKASITATNHHHHLYSTHEKELLAGFPNTGSKLRPTSMLYHHPESVAAYSTLAAAAYPFAANFSTTAAELLVTRAPPPSLLSAATNPAAAAAAAVVSASLLPPSFAALSLPAQNVCAKCNISFRMTSDLVYHMRSHHKGDHINNDMMRRRREQEKLKCPVCNESFRERHHLTRHMTAHQDKEGDIVDEVEDGHRSDTGVEVGGRRRMTNSSMMIAGHNAAAK